MITVDASALKEEVNTLTEFLQSKLQTSITMKGKTLLIDDSSAPIKTKDVKMHLNRFIHKRGFSKEYRVTVNRSLIIIVKHHKKPTTHRDKSVPPHPADTMPWFFPWKT